MDGILATKAICSALMIAPATSKPNGGKLPSQTRAGKGNVAYVCKARS